jgi:threonine aldolase
MREAMAAAAVGDDVYGEDPTINALELASAEITGKQAALFVPSGSQANIIAQLVHVTPGEEVILGHGSHCMRYEAGGGAALAGAQYCVVPGNGLFTAEDVRRRFSERTMHNPGTCLVWMENTHNMGGGIVFPHEDMKAVSELAHERGVPVHVDGARVFNAAVATGVPVNEWAVLCDTISFCLSKGLGAPVGSVLCGSQEFVDAARRMRKRLGGAMRQAGVLAAAGLHALQVNVDRLAEDHENARYLAERLDAADGIEVDPSAVETNIVMAEVGAMTAADLSARCRERGVLFHPLGERRVRFVTHLDLTREMVERGVAEIVEALAA